MTAPHPSAEDLEAGRTRFPLTEAAARHTVLLTGERMSLGSALAKLDLPEPQRSDVLVRMLNHVSHEGDGWSLCRDPEDTRRHRQSVAEYDRERFELAGRRGYGEGIS